MIDKVINEVLAKLAIAEIQHEAGQGRQLANVLEETKEKYKLMDLVKENDVVSI